MCGIVGVAGNLSPKDEVTMRRLLALDFFRGPHSTGLGAIRNNGDVHIAKLASDPFTLFGMKAFQDALDGLKSRCFIGHNRFATRGLVSHYNAHPFEFEHVVGAHNGTLDQKSWNRLEEAIGQKFAVDSQALIAGIAKLGVKDAISLCTKGNISDTGAWSLVWYDLFEGTLNFLRNEHRPMWLAYEKGFKRIFWASQWPMIDAAVRLSETGYEDLYTEGEQGFRFFPTDEDVHYKFDVGLFVTGSEKKIKPKVYEVKGREPEPVKAAVFPTPTSGMGFHNPNSSTSSTNSTTISSRGKTQRSPDNVIHWLGTEKFPLAGYMTENQFDMEIADKGCQWCDKQAACQDPGLTIYDRDNIFLCASCSGHKNPTDETPTRIYVPAQGWSSLL